MPRSKPVSAKPGRRQIQPGAVYGPFTVGKAVGYTVEVVRRKVYYYSATCRCGREYERTASELHAAKVAGGCVKCTPRHRPPPRPPYKTARNDAIIAARKAGATIMVIAAEHGITKQRVFQILKRAGACDG